MAAILERWGNRYLLGDVGLTHINYANWGLLNNKPVCIDYAYVFPVSMDIFTCICGCKEMTFSDANYTTYRCVECKTEYTDRQLRSRISNEERLELFKNVSENAIHMTDVVKEMEVADNLVKREEDPDQPDRVESIMNVNQVLGVPRR